MKTSPNQGFFGDLVNFHPHAHVLAADGVFCADGTFLPLPPVPEGLRERRHRQLVPRRQLRPVATTRYGDAELSAPLTDSNVGNAERPRKLYAGCAQTRR